MQSDRIGRCDHSSSDSTQSNQVQLDRIESSAEDKPIEFSSFILAQALII